MVAAADDAGRDPLGRYQGGPGRKPPTPVGRPRGRRGPAVFKHFKIDTLLSADERAEYDKLIADPNSTIRSLRAWLLARGHNVGSNAVAKHRISRHLELRGVREATAQAAAYAELSRRHGAGAVAEASHARFELMVMQRLFGRPDAPQMAAAEWNAFARVVGSVLANRKTVEALREGIGKAEAAAAAAAAKPVRRRVSPKDVARRMDLIMGLREPDPNDPRDAEWIAPADDEPGKRS